MDDCLDIANWPVANLMSEKEYKAAANALAGATSNSVAVPLSSSMAHIYERDMEEDGTTIKEEWTKMEISSWSEHLEVKDGKLERACAGGAGGGLGECWGNRT